MRVKGESISGLQSLHVDDPKATENRHYNVSYYDNGWLRID